MIIKAIACDGYPPGPCATFVRFEGHASRVRRSIQHKGWLYLDNMGLDFCPACHSRRRADIAARKKDARKNLQSISTVI